MKIAFLAYLPDTFGLHQNFFYLLSQAGETINLDISQLHENNYLIVSFESTKLIDTLRKANVVIPKNIIFIEDALKLIIGIPKDEGGEKLYDFWKFFTKCFNDLNDAGNFYDVFNSRVELNEINVIEALLGSAAKALKTCWEEIYALLKASDELDRFFQIELPCRQAFNHRQYHGVRINQERINELLIEVRKEKYISFQVIANWLNRSPSDLNFWNINHYLPFTDAAHLSNIEDGGKLKEAFKLGQNNSEFAKNFLQLIDAKQDETILIRSSTHLPRIYPIYDVSGTVTSRITISDPSIQNLRKSYRSLIVADEGKKLAYLDFSQFEPGILASLSKDEVLIQLYNNGDIYQNLSESIFNNAHQRDVCKKIFLGFIYGMTPERISRILSNRHSTDSEISAIAEAIDKFFSQFNQIVNFRNEKTQELEKLSFVQSLFGNKRHRKSKGPLTAKEKRWALNHSIQATASLIFKESLIKLVEKLGVNCILIPMHDAVLMQLDDDANFEKNLAIAKEIMLSSFNSRCPGINGKVTVNLTF